jgi:hypothetical protein
MGNPLEPPAIVVLHPGEIPQLIPKSQVAVPAVLLVASAIVCGVLLGINQVGWSLLGTVGAALAVALVRRIDNERAALSIALAYVGVVAVTATLVWFGPWAWASFARSTGPASGWILQLTVIAVLFGVVFMAALVGATTGMGVRRVVRAAAHR